VQDIANINTGDTIIIDNISFKMVENKGSITNETDIAIGTTAEETASAIAYAIKNHCGESLRSYEIIARNNQVIISQRSNSVKSIPLIINSLKGGVIESSEPFVCKFHFTAGATAGSKITISGVTFEYVANGMAGDDPTKIEIKDSPENSALALSKAIRNHPVTGDLIDKKMFYIRSNRGGIFIKCPLNQRILGFNINFNPGDIYADRAGISSAIVYAHQVQFTNNPVIGDAIRFTLPGGNIFNWNILGAYNINTIALSAYITSLNLANQNGDLFGELVKQEKICVANSSNARIAIYSNYNLNVQYIPAGIPAAEISPIPLSDNDVFKIKPAINVSNIRNIEGFIGKPKVSIKIIDQATSIGGNASAERLYHQAKSGEDLPTVSADGDVATLLHANIAGRTFQSIVWQGNGNNLNNKELVFTEISTGESFSINTKNLNANLATIDSTIETLTEPIEKLLSTTEFVQIRDLEIDNSPQEIINSSGRVIGNTEGMSVSLKSTDFKNKRFEDFVIKTDSTVLGNTIFVATISGQEFTCKVRSNELQEGRALTFTGSNGDILTLNIGKNGIHNLSEPENYPYIAYAIKKSLMRIGSGTDTRTGFDAEDKFKLVMPDISATKIYRNNNNEYVAKLDLLSKENIRLAQEVLTNAINKVRASQAKLQGQNDILDAVTNKLSSTIAITKDASSSYLDTDLVEASSTFATKLKSILSAVSMLQAGSKVADAGLEIIKSAA